MSWIHRHLRLFRAFASTSAVVALGLLLALNVFVAHRAFTVQRYQLGLFVLPWLVFFATLLPLIHHGWLARTRARSTNAVLRMLLLVVYWWFAAGSVLIFVAIYGHFVFGLF
jgi:hypothetical protein